MDLISVIIPIYNVRKYISRCINSVIGQSYSQIEIILVDDGSTDGSSAVCDKFAKKDSRIRVIHKKNAGVSVARNVGIENSKGKYICFLDSDDFLPKRSLEWLYQGVFNEDVELSIGSWTMIGAKGVRSNQYEKQKVSRAEKENFIQALNMPEMKGPVAKLFCAEIIKNNNLSFPENILVSEDTIFVYQYLKHCNNIQVLDKNVYYYNRLSINSATTKYYEDFHKASLLCLKEFLCNVVDDDIELYRLQVQEKIVKDFLSVKDYFLYFQNKNREEVKSKILEFYSWLNPYLRIDAILADEQSFEQFLYIYPFLEAGDIDSITARIKNINRSSKNKLKEKLLKCLISLKTFFIFKLQCGYKK